LDNRIFFRGTFDYQYTPVMKETTVTLPIPIKMHRLPLVGFVQFSFKKIGASGNWAAPYFLPSGYRQEGLTYAPGIS